MRAFYLFPIQNMTKVFIKEEGQCHHAQVLQNICVRIKNLCCQFISCQESGVRTYCFIGKVLL